MEAVPETQTIVLTELEEGQDLEAARRFEEVEEDEEDGFSLDSEDLAGHAEEKEFADTLTLKDKRPWPLAACWLGLLTVHSLGVVYGDIGTSPLYVWATILGNFDTVTEDNVLGATSLLVYSLILMVCVKYCGIILVADNKGEGGILALVSLIPPHQEEKREKTRRWDSMGEYSLVSDGMKLSDLGAPLLLGDDPTLVATHVPKSVRWTKRVCLFIAFLGAAFILGDGTITPAISVLSAVEGLATASKEVVGYEVEIGLTLLLLLFISQSFGSSKIGSCFGPIMVLWFVSIGGIGLYNVITFHPDIVKAFDPRYAYNYLAYNGYDGFASLGGVTLAFTGVEALYADLGHFGKWPVRAGWFLCAFPCILSSYFGQAAYVLAFPDAATTLFFSSIPSSFLWPMLLLATAAAIIASQAMISGTFCIIAQAISLEAWPALTIKHTSASHRGQVYIGAVNYTMMAVTLGLVLFFQESSRLAAAYGIAVTATMGMTTVLFIVMVVFRWRWWMAAVTVPFLILFLLAELVFFSSNAMKFGSGGWLPLLFAAILVVLMGSWKLGRVTLNLFHEKKGDESIRDLLGWVSEQKQRTPGVGVFLSSGSEEVPRSLVAVRNVLKTLPEVVVILHTRSYEVPRIDPEHQLTGRHLGQNVYRMTIRNGFCDQKRSVGGALREWEEKGILQCSFAEMVTNNQVTYFITKQKIHLHQPRRYWTRFRVAVYNLMSQATANPACRSVTVPNGSMVELHSVAEISKPIPGHNCFSNFLNRN